MQNADIGLKSDAFYLESDLYLKVNLIRRTKNADVYISLPDSIAFSYDEVYVNLIGRGEHKLLDLENQYPGKFASGFERKVGFGEITKEENFTLIKIEKLDLRAKNGDDLILKIKKPEINDFDSKILIKAKVLTLNENHTIKSEASIKIKEPKNGFEKVDLVKLYSLKSGDNITKALQSEIDRLNLSGNGEIYITEGEYFLSSVILRSNIHVYFDKVTLKVLPECNSEEKNYYTNKIYFPEIDASPADFENLPENYVTKQDSGHSFFENALFFAEREENVKITGSVKILGMGNLTRENEFKDLPEGKHADKVFSFKLCKNIEIGGINVKKDLWFEETLESGDDEPFYLNEDGTKSDIGIANMMKVTDGGHFIILATGCEKVFIHDLYATDGEVIRDTMDLMGCSNVVITNIYAQTAHDDIVKLGSDCSLGFTKKSKNYVIRNIIADTGCNAFQIGSETADDFEDICVDNIYVTGCGKAGFSASINDGGKVKNLHLNCGGSVGKCKKGTHHGDLNLGYTPKETHPKRSIIKRARMPFMISLSMRSRLLGAVNKKFSYVNHLSESVTEDVVINAEVGEIENLYLGHFDSFDSFWGSRAINTLDNRWPKFIDQERTTPLIIGYKIPGFLGLKFSDGTDTRKIRNIIIEDVNLTVKGGNPESDFLNSPPEQYSKNGGQRYLSGDNRASLIPAYGIYFRHTENLTLKDVTLNTESPDGRKAVVCENSLDIKVINSPEVTIK